MNERILVVDDSAINLANVEQNLKGRYEVVTVNSGARALRYLKTERPNLVLLDIRMSDMDGFETLTAIRCLGNAKDIPVIMLTSKNDKKSLVKCQKLGISDYVLKPYDPEELKKRIERALANSKNS